MGWIRGIGMNLGEFGVDPGLSDPRFFPFPRKSSRSRQTNPSRFGNSWWDSSRRPGEIQGGFWGILGLFWRHFGVLLELFWGNFWAVLGGIFGFFWGNFGAVLGGISGLFQCNFWAVLGGFGNFEAASEEF